jgi:hypothetical protein
MLKQITLRADMYGHFNVLFSAPMVLDLSWSYSCELQNVEIGELWCLHSLDLWTEESSYALVLNIDY